MKISLKLLCTAAAAMGIGMSAIAQPQDYPEGAEPLTPDALRTALAGKVFSIKPAKGPEWRWQFNENGYYFINAGSYADRGKWSTKDSSVCLESNKTPGCNEMRQKDGALYLKRDSGEIIAFKPK